MYRKRFVPNIIYAIKLTNIRTSRQIRPYVASGINVVGRNFSSSRVSEQSLPEFEGRVIKRGDTDYEAQCYQYASSSHLKDGIIQPAAIIKAKNDSDVIKAINYARSNNIAVAIRTGGHQYSGASSTNGDNIQLDLSQTYKDFTWDNSDCTSVTLGISFPLVEFNTKLGEKYRFVPHGQCHAVNIGGHVQTGGYGQLARSFGLLADHVKKFRIITADGQARWVDQQDKDLFFAVLGGSPGNFGVLTHITLNVHRDEDYPNSRGLRAVYAYDRNRVKDLLDVMVEMAADENFPADFDYTITVLDESRFQTTYDTYDEKYDTKDHSLTSVVWCPVIVVFAQWANLQGAQQTYDPTFFNKIKKAGGGVPFINKYIEVDDDKHVPISKLTSHWTFPIEREYKLPFVKRTYCSNSSSQKLKDHKWTDWVSDRIENGVPWTLDLAWDLHLAVQIQHYGGTNSRFFQNGKNSRTSHSWRDSNIICVLDAFYHSGYDPAEQQYHAEKWQQDNDKGVGTPDAPFCEHDRRVLWGSHDLDLSANQQYYYDQNPEGKYDKLCKIKQTYDPSNVFTPNRFCIGLPPVDSKVQPKITLANPEALKKAKKLRVMPHLSAEEKFQKMVNMKREDGKPVPLWSTWRV